jgi:hypothetical protein
MTHPIIPPPELVKQWRAELPAGVYDGYKYPQRETELCIQAAQWGAEQELHAICDWLDHGHTSYLIHPLLCTRRPQPPSLKEQALTALHAVATGANDYRKRHQDFDAIRQALEALPQ